MYPIDEMTKPWSKPIVSSTNFHIVMYLYIQVLIRFFLILLLIFFILYLDWTQVGKKVFSCNLMEIDELK